MLFVCVAVGQSNYFDFGFIYDIQLKNNSNYVTERKFVPVEISNLCHVMKNSHLFLEESSLTKCYEISILQSNSSNKKNYLCIKFAQNTL